ncbi:hypothetical protein POTOM_056610 [Populus tomentosa]|uniref:Uncharacterized protein n=1 Tax=Populus tomentosa TaxID=118781 RepID=A0A8X7Y2D8_POPTO|nr:hypothetical protein POTOM_056610 [Populus tomentosa]
MVWVFDLSFFAVLKERKLYRGSMRKMGSSSAEDIPAMQEIVLEFRAGKMVFYGKKVNQALGRVYILKFNTDDRKSLFGCRFSISNVAALSCCLAEFLDEEEPDASTPFQVFEDMLEDNISSRVTELRRIFQTCCRVVLSISKWILLLMFSELDK